MMERLTQWIGEDEDRRAIPRPDIRSNGHGRCCNKLAEYEDAEEQGLLVRLSVKIGDDIYKIPSKANYDLNVLNGYKANNRVYHQKVYSIVFSQSGWFVQCDKDSIHAPNVICVDVEYGKTWFLTCEEAEKKLKELKNEI
jgi:hypothetical protein